MAHADVEELKSFILFMKWKRVQQHSAAQENTRIETKVLLKKNKNLYKTVVSWETKQSDQNVMHLFLNCELVVLCSK